jgi:hypothetical protein
MHQGVEGGIFFINIIAKNIMNAKYRWPPTLHKDILQYC